VVTQIQPEECATLFHTTGDTTPQGTGMGLTISRSIVQSHGGRQWVTAMAGARGTTFHFTLPVEP